jgi:hypothetical protein
MDLFLESNTKAQKEFSNPETRPWIHTYPEDRSRRGQSRSETWHFAKWGEKAPAHSACPMARAQDGQDYYVYEPAVALIDGRLRAVMPTRFFMRNRRMHVRACLMLRVFTEHGEYAYLVDAASALCEIPLDDFRFSVTHFEKCHEELHLPKPDKIDGM